jgi:tRNA (guanine37-N1)-methyltransferase
MNSLWHVQLLTLFPEMFPGMLGCSLAGKALQSNIWSYEAVDIRHYATDKHQRVDDVPYGGGAGMVMKPDVLQAAISATVNPQTKLLYMSPRGRVLTQSYISELAKIKNIAIICGRFEGVDERVLQVSGAEEVSVGDVILSGGEVAATVLMDACIRLLPGVIGNTETLKEESFGASSDYTGLLEYPLYTRPAKWQGIEVPEVLRSGNHALIDVWRLEQAKELTKLRRPDLWQRYIKRNGE